MDPSFLMLKDFRVYQDQKFSSEKNFPFSEKEDFWHFKHLNRSQVASGFLLPVRTARKKIAMCLKAQFQFPTNIVAPISISTIHGYTEESKNFVVL